MAGGRTVAVGCATIAWRALELGLLDGIALDVVPVLLGGDRSLFVDLRDAPVTLSVPEVTPGRGVLHLAYHVQKG